MAGLVQILERAFWLAESLSGRGIRIHTTAASSTRLRVCVTSNLCPTYLRLDLLSAELTATCPDLQIID
jgi:hypothetical protein